MRKQLGAPCRTYLLNKGYCAQENVLHFVYLVAEGLEHKAVVLVDTFLHMVLGWVPELVPGWGLVSVLV